MWNKHSILLEQIILQIFYIDFFIHTFQIAIIWPIKYILELSQWRRTVEFFFKWAINVFRFFYIVSNFDKKLVWLIGFFITKTLLSNGTDVSNSVFFKIKLKTILGCLGRNERKERFTMNSPDAKSI